MVEILPMNESDSTRLECMMSDEEQEYIQHFTAFSRSGELARQLSEARNDAFFSIFSNGDLAGFFCLRGMDRGYARPSFGVYVSSNYSGKGLARAALIYAINWCRNSHVQRLMLKVSKENIRALHLYESFGFVSQDICPDTGHVIMEKVIEE